MTALAGFTNGLEFVFVYGFFFFPLFVFGGTVTAFAVRDALRAIIELMRGVWQ